MSQESTESQAIPLEGRLSDPATLPRLLAWLGRGEWSGMIVLRAGDIERRLYLADGRLSTAGSNDASDSLASYLIRAGLMTEEDRSRAAGQLRSTDRGWSFGRQLVKLGLVGDQDLARTERRRVLGIAQAALGLRTGQYACEAGVVAGDAMPNQALEVSRVIAEGVLMTWDANSALEALGGRSAILDMVPEALSEFEATGASEEYDLTFLRCDGKRSVQEVLDISPLPEAAALRFLAAMRLAGCLSTRPGVAASAVASAGRAALDPAATLPPPAEGEETPALHRDVEDTLPPAPAVTDFEAARADEVALPATPKGASGGKPAVAGGKPAAAGASGAAAVAREPAKGTASAKAGPAGSAQAQEGGARWGVWLVALLAIALVLGAGYVAWRGWQEMQAAPLESP